MPAYWRSQVRRVAFTLVEVIVALAVVLILAAVALPSLNGYLDEKNVETAATQLAIVRDALYGPGTSFQSVVGANASRLSQLSTPIIKTDPSSLNSCKLQFTKVQANNWPNGGPFVNFPIDAVAGMATPIGVAEDTLTRNPFSATTGTLRINFLGVVELKHAQMLDSYIDGSNGDATGTVQWSLPAVDGLVSLYYFVAINNKC